MPNSMARKVLNLHQMIQSFHDPDRESFSRHLTWEGNPFQNIAGKGENAGNQHFLLSSQCFPVVSPTMFFQPQFHHMSDRHIGSVMRLTVKIKFY